MLDIDLKTVSRVIWLGNGPGVLGDRKQAQSNPTRRMSMNKSDLIAAMAGRAGVSGKDAGACLDALFDVVADVVAAGEEKVNVPGWISFQQTTRKARMGRNPQTGEALHIPESKAVKISAGSKLKAAAKSGGAPQAPPEPEPPSSSW